MIEAHSLVIIDVIHSAIIALGRDTQLLFISIGTYNPKNCIKTQSCISRRWSTCLGKG